MASFVFLSWENEREDIPIESAGSIKFLDHLPNPGQEIPLIDLEIDINTLRLISKFLNIKGQFPEIKKPLPASKQGSIFNEDSLFKNFFEGLSDDELLLLTLSSHKLEIGGLSDLCTAVIASRFAEMDADEVVSDLTEEELTTNEEDFYKWTGWEWH